MRNDFYSYWVDRRVGDHLYRFADYAIKRCSANDAAQHFKVWEDFETKTEATRAWRGLCDRAAKFAALDAYKKGAQARKQGVVVGDNPYTETADEFWRWMQGWLDGAKPTNQQEQSNAVV